MVRMLSLTENLHTILRVLYDDMMVLCYPMSQVAMAIAGIGALLYIAYRVWQSLAQAEPIDLFPLMRPFAIGICILFFPTLVLGSLNGILSPLVKATHSLWPGRRSTWNNGRSGASGSNSKAATRCPRTAITPKTRRWNANSANWAWTTRRNRHSTA